ncbi:MAG: tol-pal system protein YbgF [Alphaproteobacteria bacterium]|nr:tol-pal system protein YbgF [Alphaproteobacteria bacterium]
MRFGTTIPAYRKARVSLGLLALCGGFVFAAPAFAQDTNDRINRLENEVQTLSRAIYKGETPPPGAFSGGESADTEVRLQQLETDLRTLTGKLEEQSHQIEQIRSQMERLGNDMDMRMGSSQQSPAAATTSTTMSQGARYMVQPTPPQPPGNSYQWSSDTGQENPPQPDATLGTIDGGPSADAAAAAYENAFALLKNGEYEGAGNGFQAFISKYPGHSLVSNAKYWLGETHYVRGEFEKASRIFAEAYQQYPKSSKAPDDLLKLGLSLAALGKKDDACIALGQIEKEFPTGAEPVLRRAKQEMTRFGC